jgi:hypothetical protein
LLVAWVATARADHTAADARETTAKLDAILHPKPARTKRAATAAKEPVDAPAKEARPAAAKEARPATAKETRTATAKEARTATAKEAPAATVKEAGPRATAAIRSGR